MTNSNITAETVKELRNSTGAGIMDCKRALQEAGGDLKKAAEVLQKQGFVKAEKRAQREAKNGLVDVYIHTGGRIGALVEINCESDFVARTEDFKALAHNIAMQIAASEPQYVCVDDIPENLRAEANPVEACLLSQPFIRDPQRSIQDVITEVIAKTGENIKIRRFARFELGKG
ncbi:MAG: translation elongation factor Ts [Dehalococcoidia bacterium]|jgi:elongation factor Ts